MFITNTKSNLLSFGTIFIIVASIVFQVHAGMILQNSECDEYFCPPSVVMVVV